MLAIMPYYHEFLLVMSQLADQPSARVEIHGREILIEKGKITTKIFEGDVSHSIQECVSAATLLRWPERIDLKIDSDSVYLVQRIGPIDSYRSFKTYLEQFLNLAQEWQEIVSQFIVI